MKKNLLIITALLISIVTFGQNVKLVVPIVKTGETEIEIEDENDIVIDTITISISTDDAEQENDEMDTNIDDDIDAGWEGADGDANVLTAGLRFQNITIPQGATIETAYIEVTSHEPKTADDVAKLTISAEATDDAATFEMDALITDRTTTSASVEWDIAEEWGLWTTEETPELKSIVQEIIDRSGWESGNSIAFIITGENQGVTEFENAREWESFENIADPEEGGDGANHAERVPKLYIKFNLTGQSSIIASEGNLNYSIYPNPAKSIVNVQLENAGVANVSIYNMLGQLVLQSSSTSIKNEMNVEELPAGMYHVQVKQNNMINTQKIVINK